MSVEEFDVITNEIYPLTKTICLHLMGEPLLHPNINEIFEICKSKNLNVYLTTNGTLIKKNLDLFLKGTEGLIPADKSFGNTLRQVNYEYDGSKGFVKAFAITCGIGIVVSLLSCLVFTRMFNSLVLPLVKDKEKFLGFEKLGQKVKAEV